MADTCGSDGFHSRLAIDTGGSPAFANYTSGSECFPLANGGANLKRRKEKINHPTLDGTREEQTEQTRDGIHFVEGDLNMYLTPAAFQAFGPRILGSAWDGSGLSIPTLAVPPEFHAMLHKDAYLYLYNQLRINSAVISGEVNGPLSMQLNCLGRARDETLRAGSLWPAGLNPSTSVPYMFEDCAITIGGTAYKWRRFTFTRNNNLGTRFWGSKEACGIKANGKAMNTLQLVLPHSTDTVPTILQGTQDAEYLAVVITGTHPITGMSFSITLPGVQFPEDDPPVVAGEIILDLTAGGRGVAGGATVTFFNDAVV